MNLKLKSQTRSETIDAPQADAEARSVSFSFSSETPVDRWFGAEVLSHRSGAADLTRLNSGAAPLLWNHDPNQMIGIVEKAWIDNGRGYATARFSSNDLGRQIQQDVQDGIIRNVSFGYRILEMTTSGEKSADSQQTFTAAAASTPPSPHEYALCSIQCPHGVCTVGDICAGEGA